MQPRIALIHATRLAIDPIEQSFKVLWPMASVANLLDESLSSDLALYPGQIDRFAQRFITLGRYAVASGAQAILFTCSAFGTAIDRANPSMGVLTLKPNQAMFDDALAFAANGRGRIGLLTTFAPAADALLTELQAMAALQGLEIQITQQCIPEAMAVLAKGDVRLHDQLLQAAVGAMGELDVLILGQFSMARAASVLQQRLAFPVLTSPDSAVRRLRNELGSR